ncbi:hypothetical protein FOMPIDRAFT_1025842 [Fomitopsis schrenkii]|uniref:Uncharacterized protein n=1 Tax=Fomitopsis schrenkii TaxID=2126942 RepID=S8F0N3_FOMSC|nr:hypothetical protein FOMPIDRAFT_1025842 [Fomitopsis schrenkii]
MHSTKHWGWTRQQVAQAWTKSPLTKDFRHLLPLPLYWQIRRSRLDPVTKFTKAQDRIKYWNIVPGDEISLRNDRTGKIYQVNHINRLTNRVSLMKETDESSQTGGRVKSVPYSTCQLLVGRYEFPAEGDSTEAQTKPVFALRVGTDNHRWAGYFYAWDRYATATSPRLPHHLPGEKVRVHVPWPQSKTRSLPDPGPYDTLESAVLEVTYKPPTFPVFTSLADPQPQAPSEHEYITAARNPTAASYDPSLPAEVLIARELANPHSRAKKQARWQAHELHKRSLLQKFVKEELKNLDGRKRREARAEATWKWRRALVDERRAEVKRRWQNRGAEDRLTRKKARKERKADKRKERLRNLVLENGPNQFVPSSANA